MRSVYSSLMAALVMVALFWGNCLSCPQILLSLKAHQPAHGCCKRGQKPATDTCQNQGMQHFLKTDPGTQAHAAPVAEVIDTATVATVESPRWAPVAVDLAAHAPPDLLALHSSFRI